MAAMTKPPGFLYARGRLCWPAAMPRLDGESAGRKKKPAASPDSSLTMLETNSKVTGAKGVADGGEEDGECLDALVGDEQAAEL